MTTPLDNYLAAVPADKTSLTDDERIENIVPLPPPEHLIRFFPIQGTPVESLISETRRSVRQILHGRGDRLLVVMGPCSIHDPLAALEYAGKLEKERRRHGDELELLMRVYFEKPRTTVGWKGLINDPYLDGSFRINEGLRIARDLLVRINRAGMPAGCEFLDVISPQYIGDLVSWGAIGARTTESQVHRELASGLSAPVGFKNGTDGNVRIAVDAVLARQLAGGEKRIVGVMVESHLVEGRQELEPGEPLRFGQSITDACLGWDDSVQVLDALAQGVKQRRKHRK